MVLCSLQPPLRSNCLFGFWLAATVVLLTPKLWLWTLVCIIQTTPSNDISPFGLSALSYPLPLSGPPPGPVPTLCRAQLSPPPGARCLSCPSDALSPYHLLQEPLLHHPFQLGVHPRSPTREGGLVLPSLPSLLLATQRAFVGMSLDVARYGLHRIKANLEFSTSFSRGCFVLSVP